MSEPTGFQRFIAELRRRHVPQTAAIYVVAAWAVIQFADVVAPNLGWPQVVVTAVIIAAAVGLPVVLVLAWVFDWGPEGIHRTEDQPAPGTPAAAAGAARSSAPWVAVIAVLVVGIGSALGVALLLTRGGEPAAEATATPTPRMTRGERAARPGAEPGTEPGTEGEASAPQAPPPPAGVLPGFSDSLMRSIGENVAGQLQGLGGLDSAMRIARRLEGRGEEAGPIEILEPATWRYGVGQPLAPGDSVKVVGVARDSSGVTRVDVAGRTVARAASPEPALEFETWVKGREGQREVAVVAYTRGGEIRRVFTLFPKPGPS